MKSESGMSTFDFMLMVGIVGVIGFVVTCICAVP